MKKLSVKIISITLAICLLIGVVPMSIFAEEGDNNVYVDVTLEADKTDYADGESIIFNGAIVNSSSKDCDADVEIDLYATPSIKLDTKSLKVNALAAGESHDLTVEATANRIHFGFELIQAVYDIITGYMYTVVLELVSLLSSNYECVRVCIDRVPAAIIYKVDSSVVLSDEEENTEIPDVDITAMISIDKSPFLYNEETGIYYVYESIDNVSGILKKVKDIKTLTFEVRDSNDVLIDSGVIEAKENWSSDDIGFIAGKNTLKVKAEYLNGKTYEDSLTAECYFNSKSDKLDINIETDSDKDGLVDYLENYVGSNINKPDTDSDGLTDYQEVVFLGTNPCVADTDNDGISDYDSDYDSDNLSNGYEFTIGTNPSTSDSDSDDVDDNDEISIHNTDPLKSDTDDDGANDGWEIDNNFDPLVYNESFTIQTDSADVSEYNPVSASVSANIGGTQVKTLEVKPINYSDNSMISKSIPGYLGSAFDFSVEGEFDSATLIFNYDESLGEIGPNFQPRIYYLNEETKELEELPNQTVEDGRVMATVEHFSTYILLNKVEFDKVWETEIKPPEYEGNGMTGIDVVFVVDSSGSMDWNDSSNIRHMAVKNFVDKLGENDRAAVVDFDGSAYLLQDFTNNKTDLYNAVNRIDSNGGTNLSNGMNSAINQFINSTYTRTDAYKYVIFLTDGDGSYNTSYTSKAANNNIVVYTIGLGSGVQPAVLKGIAEGTGGKYYFASNASQLPDIYNEVSFETIDYKTDTNNDGISDYFTKLICEGSLVLSNGSNEFKGIDFNLDSSGTQSDDYDNDGLKNGEELIVSYNENTGRVSVKMVSNPMMKHSDGDGVDDLSETSNGTDPLKIQYDKYYTDWLYNNSNYYYEDYVSMYDDSTIYQLDSAFLSVVFGVWNTEELYRDILADYFLDYVEPINSIQKQEERAVFVDMADNFLDGFSKAVDFAKNADFAKDIIGNVKNLISVANGYETTIEAISIQYVKIVEQVTAYFPDAGIAVTSTRTMSSTSVSVLTKNSPLKTGKISGVSIAFDVLGGAIDMFDTISTLAAVNANARVFDENIDFLTEMRDRGYRLNIKNAAKKIIESLGEGYGNAMANALAQDAGELTVNVLISIASANPYVKAVVFMRDVIDKITGMSAVLRIEYQMLAYNCMSYSIKNLIYDDVYNSNGYYYSVSGNIERYLTHLAQIRILGERKYDEFYSTGANAWFNDEEEIHSRIETSISNVKTCASKLNLTLKV